MRARVLVQITVMKMVTEAKLLEKYVNFVNLSFLLSCLVYICFVQKTHIHTLFFLNETKIFHVECVLVRLCVMAHIEKLQDLMFLLGISLFPQVLQLKLLFVVNWIKKIIMNTN